MMKTLKKRYMTMKMMLSRFMDSDYIKLLRHKYDRYKLKCEVLDNLRKETF
jgi:hypothetical protein